ncbi:GNAT family N-acetyltransferase [Ktedonobacter racemifer]|uniref:GCN5-related N-acetyltransferase n=1 Tax=Ktedonobacter racemifer DSM 44963 TaxID=485913 RepID=D6TSY4_KTERA|nr:GNAT family N-acetyltransferase [Ktedonobacter racemifer]EFH83535.1 GCN5-related N-acetyltransferase [Ktedonobacter racemifer DSM 44963]
MQQMIESLSHPALIEAMETNTEAFVSLWGRALGATFYHEAGASWFITGGQFLRLNMGIQACLTPDTPREKIDEMLSKIEAHNVPLSWPVGPSLQHPTIEDRVKARGWSIFPTAGMARDLQDLDEHIDLPTGVTLERIDATESLQLGVQTIAAGMPWPDAGRDYIMDVVRKHGFVAHPSVRYYLARLNGQPVATSILYLASGVAGLYCVATVPSARGRGIGRAISHLPLLDARDMGYRVAILQATEKGERIYSRLGFHEVCRIHFWQR